VLARADQITRARAGSGAVRELIEVLLAAREEAAS
jgi:3-deoxy-D-manno-octulosonate 8-phosphate phosphatase KdsC-like HAD superfamily phosphatase